MEQPILVSIITIVYNGQDNIERAIKSVIDQTYRNIEYIIIDGGSTDNTLSIIKKFGYAVTNLVSEKDQGIADAFNKGINRANGALIGIINSDDWYEPDAVEKIVRHIGNHDIAYGDQQYWKGDQRDYVIKGNLSRLPRQMSVNHPTVFVKAACYRKYGFFDPNYRCAMDYDVMLRFMVNGCTFIHVPSIIANMQWGGFSDEQWIIGCRETLEIKNRYLPGRRLWNKIYFLRHVMGIRVPKFLQSIGLGFVVKGYRQKKYEIRSRVF
jgi:glycosyltransferase involved in cell wall biosynthesis